MKTKVAASLCLLAVSLCWLQSARAVDMMTIVSRSGQFTIRGLPLEPLPSNFAPTSSVSFVRLDPATVAVSCERIKDALLSELDSKDTWRGAIAILLHPVREDNEPIVVTAVHFKDGWGYRIEVPEKVDRTRWIKTIVQVLLTEMANRRAGTRAAELPPWLHEGLSAELRATSLATLLLEPQVWTGWDGKASTAARTSFSVGSGLFRRERNPDPLRRARELLRLRAPLTLNELNWPAEEPSAEDAAVYESCAQLFVHELLRLKNGPACLREMLDGLPRNLNWQTAFLRAFRPYFQSLLDIDKWWALNVVRFTGRDPLALWSHEESIRQLDEILSTPVQVRVQAKELPLSTQVTLAGILTEWDYQRQRPVLMDKVNRLQALRLRASQSMIRLVDDYRLMLQSYLERRNRAGGTSSQNQLLPAHRPILDETLRRLEVLDTLRSDSHSLPKPAPPANDSNGQEF